ncbi:MAG TPA: Hsp20/alpha crystallin family protein [Planktothrix sp.]
MKTLIPWGRRQMPAKQTEEIEGGGQLIPSAEFDRLFENFFGNMVPYNVERDFMPSLDVRETEKAVEVSAELPGVDEKDIKVTLTDHMLAISGEKKSEKDETKDGHRRIERRYGSFMRSVPLPPYLDSDKVDAKYKDGVLTISIPKSAEYENKVRSIPVRTDKGATTGDGGGNR